VNSFEGSSTSLPKATETLIFVVELLEVEGWGSTNFKQKKSQMPSFGSTFVFLFVKFAVASRGNIWVMLKTKLLSPPGQFSPKIMLPLRCVLKTCEDVCVCVCHHYYCTYFVFRFTIFIHVELKEFLLRKSLLMSCLKLL